MCPEPSCSNEARNENGERDPEKDTRLFREHALEHIPAGDGRHDQRACNPARQDRMPKADEGGRIENRRREIGQNSGRRHGPF